jgi:hypothetical protein
VQTFVNLELRGVMLMEVWNVSKVSIYWDMIAQVVALQACMETILQKNA